MTVLENMDEKNITHALLEGAFFHTFTFNQYFRLTFECQRDKEFKDKKLPREITLTILSDWWFGDKEEWDRIVKRMTEGCNYVEPEEPVLAFRLAALRWSGGAYIDSVNISPEKTELIFTGGERITILNHDIEDCAWEISETNYKDLNNSWSVLCDGNGEISYDIPEETIKWDDSKNEIMNIIDTLENSEKIQIPFMCPICHTYNAHIYMHRHEDDRGTIWTWCSSCKTCMHGSRMKLPDWWTDSDFVDDSELTSHPIFLEPKANLIDKHLKALLGM